MGAQFTIPLITVIPGQLIASALWNNEFQNLNTNLIPAGLDSYSDTDAQMQIQTAPYPGSILSHASNLGGEIERIRYQIAAILGTTYWYEAPTESLSTTADSLIPVGGVIDYPSATAPNANFHLADGTEINRTIYATLFALIGETFGAGDGSLTFNLPNYTDKMSIAAGNLYALAATGGALTGTASHSHTVDSHAHTLSGHTHLSNYNIVGSLGLVDTVSSPIISADVDGAIMSLPSGPVVGGQRAIANQTMGPSTNVTNSVSPATDTQAPTVQVLNPYLAMYKMIRVL